jgi:hypothetical protein
MNTILVFGIITIAMVAAILVGVVVILATVLIRKKLRIHTGRPYTVNDQSHLYDKIFMQASTINYRDNLQESKVSKPPVYEDIELWDADKEDQYEISRCPAYEESTEVLSTN